jgi:hypothetical protein
VLAAANPVYGRVSSALLPSCGAWLSTVTYVCSSS